MRIVLLVLLAGCGVTQDNWSSQLADAICDVRERCEPETFAIFEDFDDCTTRVADSLETLDANLVGEGCTVDLDAVGECVRTVHREKDCDALTDQTDVVCDVDVLWIGDC